MEGEISKEAIDRAIEHAKAAGIVPGNAPIKLPSASRWPRVMRCPGSAVLPQYTPDDSAASTVGRLVHRFIEQAASEGRDAALAALPADQPQALRFCEALDLDELPVDAKAFAHELPFLYWPDTGLAVQGALEPRPPDTIALVCDVVGVSSDAVYTADFKTGWTDVGSPSENWQMRVTALVAARAFSKQRCVSEIIVLRDDGATFTQRAVFDEPDLDEIEAELADQVALLRGIASRGVLASDLREGPHCRYCPAFRACPAKVAMINAVMQSPSATIDSIKANLTVQNAAAAYARYKMLKAAVNEIQAAIYAFATEHPIPTEDGQVLRLVHSPRERLDGDAVHRLMKELHGEAAADQAVSFTSSKSAVEDVFRTLPRAKGETIKGRMEDFLSKLREAGGVKTSESDTVQEVRA